MAQKALTGSRIDFDDANGFFRPFYWLGLIVEYLIGGLNPFWFYFTNLVVFWIIVAEIIALIRLKGGSIIQSSLGAIIFALSSPIVESFFTNSKPEAQQLMWLAGSLLSGHFLAHPKKEKRITAAVSTTLFILFASLNKSTFIALIPVSLGWVVLYWLFLKKDQDEKRRAVGYFISSLVATAAYFILRKWAMPIGILQGTYTNDYILNINFMIFMLNHWVVWLSRGFLGFLIGLVLLFAFWKKVGTVTRRLSLASLVWMAGWFAVYLPWGHALDYYLLPFAFGYAVFCGMTLGSVPSMWSTVKLPVRIGITGLAGLFSLFIMMGISSNFSNARIQLIMDKQNMKLLTYLEENTPLNVQIAVNYNKNATFFTHVHLLAFFIGNRGDIQFLPFEFQNTQVQGDEPYLLITPRAYNQPLVKVRGIGDGHRVANKSIEAFIGKTSPLFATEGKATLLTFNPALLLCPFMNSFPFYSIYCNKPESLLVDNREFSYGWQVYRIDKSMQNLISPAVITKDGDFLSHFPDVSSSKYSFPSGHQAMSIDWNDDGKTDILLFDPVDLTWQVFSSPVDQMDHEFILLGMKSDDIPLAGDWDCDGKATPGYFRPSEVSWHLLNDLQGDEVANSLTGARPTDLPLVGDWDGDGCDSVGIYRSDKGEVNLENQLTADLSGIDFNAPTGSIPVPAEWGGNGVDTLGFFKDGQWMVMYANCECVPANGFETFEFGSMDDIPLAGRWR